MAADTYDALNQNTRVSGNWAKGKVPTFPEWPRPKPIKEKGAKKRRTVADIYKQFSGR